MKRAVIAVLISVVLGCGGGGDGSPDAQVSTDGQVATDGMDGSETRVFFLNRAGGSYTPGPDDSSTNQSSIMSGSTTVQPWVVDDTEWNALLACVASKFAAFNVDVTDVDPGATVHVEVVLVGNPQQVPPLDNGGVIGISPSSCTELRRAIVLANGPGVGSGTAQCENVAHLLGSSVGLDKSYHCPDLMTFLSGCGDKSFVDMDVPCGEYEARTCGCGGSTQNTHQILTERLGAASSR